MINQTAVICMVAEMIFAFAVPIAAALVWRHKTKASMAPFFGGVITFIVFAQVLESGVHSIVLLSPNPVSNLLNSNFILYALYGGLMAGIFEEAGRYITFKFVLKNYRDKVDAVTYGLGHGGIECMLVLGLGMAVNVIFAVLVNSGADESLLLPLVGGSAAALDSAVASISEITPLLAGIAVFERIMAMGFHLCLSVVVFAAVRKNSPKYLVAAIAAHAAADFGIVMLSHYTNIYVAELALAVFVAALAYWVFKVKRGEL